MRTLGKVNPTPEQLPILEDAAPGVRLIRGAAGSGKTTTALLRLRQQCRARIARQERMGSAEPVRVLALTFNQTLSGYIKQLASEQIPDAANVEFTTDTFAHWALGLVGSDIEIQRDYPDKAVRPMLRHLGGTVSENLDYFVDEIQYITGRFTRENRSEYLTAERTGRGRAPAVNRQLRERILRGVVEPYEALKERQGCWDWNDLALAVANVPNQRYDVVIADETQDFSANQMRGIIAHLDGEHSTTFIMDAAQRIYPRGFSWREIGINMQGRARSLERNYRNTAEIARLAASLVKGLPMDEDGVLPDAGACQTSGHKPKVVAGLYRNQIGYMLNAVQPFLDADETVAILQPFGRKWFDFAKQVLRQRGIEYCELTRNDEWPTGPELVALSTIHSAKGLEFDHVLMPGLSQEVTPHGADDDDGTLDSLRRLVAMGIGRSRRTVMLGYKPGEESTLIGLLDRATYDLVEV